MPDQPPQSGRRYLEGLSASTKKGLAQMRQYFDNNADERGYDPGENRGIQKAIKHLNQIVGVNTGEDFEQGTGYVDVKEANISLGYILNSLDMPGYTLRNAELLYASMNSGIESRERILMGQDILARALACGFEPNKSRRSKSPGTPGG